MKTKPTLLELFQHLEKLMKVCFYDAFQLLNTPEALKLGIEVLKLETYHVRQYAKKLEDEWEKQLPFNCNEEKGVDWFYWTRVFNWQRIHSFSVVCPNSTLTVVSALFLKNLRKKWRNCIMS